MPTVVAGSRFPGGLVGEHDQRTVDERAGDGHALLLATGELRREAAGLLGQADEIEHLGDLRAHHVAGPPDDLHGERDVLVDGLVGQQLEVLEDTADVATELRDLPVAQLRDVAPGDDDASRGGLLLPQEEAEEGRFPGARRAHQEDEFTLLDLGRHFAQGGDITLVDLGDVLEANHFGSTRVAGANCGLVSRVTSGDAAYTLWRRQCRYDSMNPSRSPSSTACTFPVSYRVRSSFTNW